jgi:PmbA protein
VQRGRSLFADREGEEVAHPALRLADDGTHPEGPSSSPFDGEGSPSRRTPLIEEGRLLTFLFDVRTARVASRDLPDPIFAGHSIARDLLAPPEGRPSLHGHQSFARQKGDPCGSPLNEL